MIHGHGALGDGVHGEFVVADHRLFKRLIPKRDGIEVGFDAFAMVIRRLHFAMALGCEAELLQGLGIELVDDGFWLSHEAKERRPVQIVHVDVAIVFHAVWQFLIPVAAVVDVGFELVWIDRPAPCHGAVFAAETCEWTQDPVRVRG